MKKLILLMCALLIVGCKHEKQAFTDSTLQAGFDTIIQVKLYAYSQEEFDKEFDKVSEKFLFYNDLFDKYHNYDMNNIKTINDNAGKQPVEVDQELIDMLLLSKKYSDISNNQFNVTLGPVLNIWHSVRDKAEFGEDFTIPTQEKLEQAKVCSGWDKVEIDDEKNTVYLNQSCASLDVGAVAKGYATQKVADMLINDGYINGFINAGGNIKILGSKLDGAPWKTGILAPKANNQMDSLVFLDLNDKNSFVTSGDYQRFFMYNGEIMHHIIDPDTLYPARHAKSVSILTEDSGIADILSTTLYTMTYQEGYEFIQNLQKEIDVEVVWIYDKLDEIKNEKYSEVDEFYVLATPKIAKMIK